MTYRWVSLMSLLSPYWNCSETRFGMLHSKEHKWWDIIFLGEPQRAVPLQARNPACKPLYLPVHHLHPADKAALVIHALQNTVFCSEKFKIKILKLHHQKGRITTRLPSWNERESLLLLTCRTALQNLVGYKIWPKSMFRFMFFFSTSHLR